MPVALSSMHTVFTITAKVDAAFLDVVEGAESQKAKEHCVGFL